MCGIAGIFRHNSDRPTTGGVQRMCQALLHRGPDDGGIAEFNRGTLGMRRLAIFDPAHGHQPMTSPGGRHTLVFNGAIYNHRDLRADLRGHWQFATECDTEVLLAAFVQWGARCLDRLRGMFAFAVWDEVEGKLFVARDPFGIKPLYFSAQAGGFIFASEIRALLASDEISRCIDPTAPGDVLAWGAVPGPRTVFADIESLPPATSGVWQKGRFTQEKYWHLPFATRLNARGSEADFIRDLRVQLEDVTRVHLQADVPVGAFLSGGLDSAALCALASRQRNAPLSTFSIGFADAVYSENGYAEETAAFLGTRHETMILGGKTVAGDFEKILGVFDQPTGDGINTFYVSQLAHRGGMKVSLSGLGGDELFGGYPSFAAIPGRARALKFWNLLPLTLRWAVIAHLRNGDTRQRKLADLLAAAKSWQQVLGLSRRFFSSSEIARLLLPSSPAASPHPVFHPAQGWLEAAAGTSYSPSSVSAWEITTYMSDVLLRDSDVMSMANSLELRVPFVDRPLVEWLAQQPDNFRATRPPKRLLYAALADLLPPGLRLRHKRGFTLPLAQWMRQELRAPLEGIFSSASLGQSGFFQVGNVQRCWTEYLNRTDSREWSRVWTLAMLVAYVNRHGTSTTPTR